MIILLMKLKLTNQFQKALQNLKMKKIVKMKKEKKKRK